MTDDKPTFDNKAARERSDWMMSAAESDIETHGLRDVVALAVEANRIIFQVFDSSMKIRDDGVCRELGNLGTKLGGLAHQILARLQKDAGAPEEVTMKDIAMNVDAYAPAVAMITDEETLLLLSQDTIGLLSQAYRQIVATAIGCFLRGKKALSLDQRGAFSVTLQPREAKFHWDTIPVFRFSILTTPKNPEPHAVIESCLDAIEFNDDGTIQQGDAE